MRYEVRRPYTDGPDRWRSAAVVSRHRTFDGALRSLRRQREGSRSQGGFCQDGIVLVTPYGVQIMSSYSKEDE
jgi:hypothetical protein